MFGETSWKASLLNCKCSIKLAVEVTEKNKMTKNKIKSWFI